MAKATKKKAPGTGEPGASVVDIPHEEVPNTNGQVAITPTVITVEDQIKLELAKFNVADSAIAKMKEEYGALTIADNTDKKGYEAVKKAWNHTRSTRTSLEKKGLELRSAYKVITTAISGEEDRLVDLITPLEEDLYKKWKAIDDEKERAKKEQEEAEQKQLMARVEEVQSLGMTFKDGFYQIGDTVAVDVASLRMYNEEQYGKLKGAITAKKAELDKIAADAADKLRQENEQRQKEQADLKRQQDELKKQQDDMQRQRDQLEKDRREAAKLKQDNRTSQLVAIGMTRMGEKFIFNNDWNEPFEVMAGLVFEMDADQFAQYLTSAKATITEQTTSKEQHLLEVEKEKQALEDHKKFIAATMDRAGFNFSYTAQSFTWEDKNTAIEVTFAELIPLGEPEISDKAEALKIQIQEAQKLTEDQDKKAKAAADKEAKLALGDKDRYAQEHAAIATAATKMVPGEFKTAKYQQRAQKFLERLTNLLNEFN